MKLVYEENSVKLRGVYLILGFLVFVICDLEAQRPFITTWQSDLAGNSQDNQVLIPGTGSDYSIEWEEVGNSSNSGSMTGEDATLVTFPHPGVYRVSITGNFTQIWMAMPMSDYGKLLTVDQWGDIQWESMGGAFTNCENLEINATDSPDLSRVESMVGMFRNCSNLNSPIGHWDLSNVESIAGMFQQARSFNQPIGDWDVSSVYDMRSMFSGASSFNQDISNWDVSNVRFMDRMFAGATSFNQPLNDWDVSNVTAFIELFHGARSFNQPLDKWDVSNVIFMGNMFRVASRFDQSLASWNLHPVHVSMPSFFDRSGMSCTSYDSTLIGWFENPGTPSDVRLGAQGLQYRESRSARDSLIMEKGWEIRGDEFAPCECAQFLGPEIGLSGPENLCDSDSTVLSSVYSSEEYLWYGDGELIEGENGEELLVTEAGNYTLQFVDEYGCESGVSEVLMIHAGGPGHPPELVNSGGLKLRSLAGECKGYAFYEAEVRSCSPRSEIEERSEWRIDLFNTGQYDIVSSETVEGDNLTIDIPLPLGTHRVFWVLRDEYGNENEYEEFLTLMDKNPPEPICFHGLSTSLGKSGEVVLSAKMFDAGSRDDCTELEDLTFSFSSDPSHYNHQWTCDDLEGEEEAHFPVELWVTNAYGHQNYCRTYILLQDSRKSCSTAGSITQSVSGQVTNMSGKPVEDVKLQLIGNVGLPILQRTTGQFGLYDFGLVDSGYTFLRADKEGEASGGLSTLDVLMIQKHILGVQSLEWPYSLIAADVNRDGSINALDVQEIRRVLLGNAGGFNRSKNWVLLPEQSYEEGREVPDYNELLTIDSQIAEQKIFNWTSVKTGDVNHSYHLNGEDNRIVEDAIEISVRELQSEDKGSVEFAFFPGQEIEIEGMQLSIQFTAEKLDFSGYESGKMELNEGNFGFSQLSEGRLGLSWSAPMGVKAGVESPLFVLKFEPKKSGLQWGSLRIDNNGLKPEIYAACSPTSLRPELVPSGSPKRGILATEVLPNPFRKTVAIGFELAQPSEVKLRVYNLGGMEILNHSGLYDAGRQQYVINGARLHSAGIYLFSLSTGEGRAFGRLMYLD